MNNKRKLIIGVLALLLVMTMGYALFSETVTIGGTAKANGNFSLDLYNPDGTKGLDIKVNGVGSSGTAKIDPSRKILTVTANLDYPTAYIEIPVKVKNTGNIDLYVSDVNFGGKLLLGEETPDSELDLSELMPLNIISYEGINKYDLIKKNEEKLITVKAKWYEDGHLEWDIRGIELNLSISAVQEINDNDTGVPTSPYKYAIGDEVIIDQEKFNVIDEDLRTVSLLSQYVVLRDGSAQTLSNDSNTYGVAFADVNPNKKPSSEYGYWTDDNGDTLPEYGTKEYPDVYKGNVNIKKIVDLYVDTLSKKLKINSKQISGRILTTEDFKKLQCQYSNWGTCQNSPYYNIINKGQGYWASSAYSPKWVIAYDGFHAAWEFTIDNKGVRPVITIDKKYLK